MLDVAVGTAPVNWNNQDVPGYRPNTPYGQMLDEMAAAGYTATEFDSEFPADPAQTARDLAARGLRPASTFCAVNLRDAEQQPSEIERALRRADYVRSLGGDTLIIADSGDDRRRQLAGHVGEGNGLDEGQWRNLAQGLRDLAARARERGISVVFHNHVGTYVETAEELDRLLALTDPGDVGLCYDIGHMLYGGGDIMQVLERHGPRVRYLHLKDVDLDVLRQAREEELSFAGALLRGIFTEFGGGGVDFGAFFGALSDLDYRGWIIIEQDTTKKTPLESARINREYLRRNFGL